jgi:hypothetical protein
MPRRGLAAAAMTTALMAGLAAAPAAAWDDQGHMMVAAVAFDHLTPHTRSRVAALLLLNQYPTNGTNNAAARDQKKAAFMMAATRSRCDQARSAEFP